MARANRPCCRPWPSRRASSSGRSGAGLALCGQPVRGHAASLYLGRVDGRHRPGSFFGSSVFQDFARILDDWASTDPGQLAYFGGKSLLTQSHGQSIMSFFKARYAIKGLYLLDEPETALSPRTQIELLDLLTTMSAAGHAQFIIATHSPILLSCPGARSTASTRSPSPPSPTSKPTTTSSTRPSWPTTTNQKTDTALHSVVGSSRFLGIHHVLRPASGVRFASEVASVRFRLNPPANGFAAVTALASKDEVFVFHFRRLQKDQNRRSALPAEDILENLVSCPLGDSPPSPCCFRRERINWMNGHYHLFFSSNATAYWRRSSLR